MAVRRHVSAARKNVASVRAKVGVVRNPSTSDVGSAVAARGGARLAPVAVAARSSRSVRASRGATAGRGSASGSPTKRSGWAASIRSGSSSRILTLRRDQATDAGRASSSSYRRASTRTARRSRRRSRVRVPGTAATMKLPRASRDPRACRQPAPRAHHHRLPDCPDAPVAPDQPSSARLPPRIDLQCIPLHSDVIPHYPDVIPLHCQSSELHCQSSADDSECIPLHCR